MATRTLYLCYFGLREPLVQTQVLPYLRQLSRAGFEVYLLTFEPRKRKSWSPHEIKEWRGRLQQDGIQWFSLPYHKRPSLPATLYDIINGSRYASRLVREHNISILHGRSHIGAAIGAITKKLRGGHLVFDIRGFLPEEYVDAGHWPANGYLYRLTKWAERHVMAAADGFVVLTERAKCILFPARQRSDPQDRPVEVIPCCVDLSRFNPDGGASDRERIRKEMGLSSRRVIVYVGALGGWYLTDEMARFLAAAHSHDRSVFSMILTQSPPEMIAGRLQELGISENDYIIRKVPPDEVPDLLKAADIALSFIKPCYSKLSSSPTKVAEYLISGLPIICNSGIGDLDETIEQDRVGVIVRNFSNSSYLEALNRAEELRNQKGFAERCHASAIKRFDLDEIGGARYIRLYDRLLENTAAEADSARPASLRTLYLCYFGLREPLVQTQVLPYLRQLSSAGYAVYLLTFEPKRHRSWSSQEVERWREQLQKDGIQWFSLPYHKWPSLPLTAYDILRGAQLASRLIRKHNIDVIHARSHVPMAMALLAKRFTKCRLIFDFRGLMPEEYTDNGTWNERSLTYRLAKRLERAGMREADQMVVLTRRVRDFLVEGGLAKPERVEVIPCCVDLARFENGKAGDKNSDPNRFEVVYAGSVTGLYLLDEMARFFLEIRKRQPDAFFRVITQSSSGDVGDILRRAGLNRIDFSINSLQPDEVPSYLCQARLALSFRKPTFSQIAASPTKIPEYLAAGLGVVCGPGIGDMDSLLESAGVGIVVPSFDSGAYGEAAEKALRLANDPGLRERCLGVVDGYFDLERIGFAGYRHVYERVRDHSRVSTGEFTTS